MRFSCAELLKAFEEGYAERIHHDIMDGDELTLTGRVLDAAARGNPFTMSDLSRAATAMWAARERIDKLIKGQQAMADEHRIRVATGQAQLDDATARSEEHTSELQSLMRISYAVFCLKNKKYEQQQMLLQDGIRSH